MENIHSQEDLEDMHVWLINIRHCDRGPQHIVPLAVDYRQTCLELECCAVLGREHTEPNVRARAARRPAAAQLATEAAKAAASSGARAEVHVRRPCPSKKAFSNHSACVPSKSRILQNIGLTCMVTRVDGATRGPVHALELHVLHGGNSVLRVISACVMDTCRPSLP